MEIGEKVRILREAQSLTLQDLAEQMGIHQVTLSQYERGTRPVPWGLPERIAETLGVDPDVFRASEPWHRLEEARRQYDAVISEVQAILKSARDTADDATNDSQPGAAHVAKTRPEVTPDFCSRVVIRPIRSTAKLPALAH